MGNRHFVTVLGTGNYAKCFYEMEGAKKPPCETAFVQIAVLEQVMKEYMPGDKITVFATQTAEENNWHTTMATAAGSQDSAKTAQASGSRNVLFSRKHVYGKKTSRTLPSMISQNNSEQDNPGSVDENAQNPPEKTLKIGLYDLLQKNFPLTEKQIVRIPEGKNSRELNEIFECIYRELSDGEVVYFDFTHGLRNLPMLVLTVVNYAKVLKNIQVGGLYYGAFELRDSKEKDPVPHAPLLDMSYCSEVLDWTSAAESFVKTGSSNQIKSLFDQNKKKPDEADDANKIPDEYQENVNKADDEYQNVVDRLFDLTNCLETSRGMIVYGDKIKEKYEESIYAAYSCFQNSYDELNDKELSDIEQPIKRLLEYVYDDVKILDSKLLLKQEGKTDPKEMKYTALGMAAVKWAIGKKLIQQGYTALNETLISYACELYGVRASRYGERETVRQIIKSVDLGKENYPAGFELEFRQSNWRKKFKNDRNSSFEETAMKLLSLPDEVFSLSKLIGEDRNSLSHFGIQNSNQTPAYTDLANNLSARYEQMMKIIKANPNIDTTQYM